MLSTLSIPPIFPGIFIPLRNRCLEAVGMPTLGTPAVMSHLLLSICCSAG